MTGQVAVVGAALSDCGRVDAATPFALHYQAASRALADAGLTHADVDGFGSTGLGVLAPVEVAEYLGLRPTWMDSTSVGGSTWEVMLEHAVDAIRAGTARTVLLVYGSTTRADLKKRLRTANLSLSSRGPSQFGEWEDFTVSPAAVSGQLAFERAGLTPADVDVCQFYDSFTSTVLLTFEALGFCGRGEGGAYLEGGTMRVGGRMPTNTDGGGLSSCHPGMRGIFLLVEAVRQLRGQAAGRQVPDAKVACVNGTGGWFSSTSTVLLGVH
ncbi:thiolase C-terminal domain-containing protein [Frankia sp. AgKG'84/4]|uniref:thiolase C-terminal domain-containing protein n=1 Tax=Frankia sp. AgKG'84/4 TaxID=573490 RepID=UPI00200D0872|nr:acetyl-CoA acetyltransferase [Frankia sp. AgKG'84/4]MCL9794374.1 acetyl-CoA acetyltransferase [Frankia sp. AgKG'84/4]